MAKKFIITFRPKGTKAKFTHREFNTRTEAEKKVNEIKKIPIKKRKILNPRVSKNPFFKK